MSDPCVRSAASTCLFAPHPHSLAHVQYIIQSPLAVQLTISRMQQHTDNYLPLPPYKTGCPFHLVVDFRGRVPGIASDGHAEQYRICRFRVLAERAWHEVSKELEALHHSNEQNKRGLTKTAWDDWMG
jgi:hypothetical protein